MADPSRATEYLVRSYPEARFGGFTDVDGSVVFYNRVNALMNPGTVTLDVGCGRGAASADPVPYRRSLRTLRAKGSRVVGIDLDAAGAQNEMIDEFRLIEGPRWPVDSESVHLLVADWVIEHLRDVDGFFAECRRVLAPAGYVCLRTANALSYVGLAARLIPNRHQATVLAMVQENRAPKDVFPTLYRCNTRRKLSARLRAHGFDAYVYSHDAEPSYLAFSKFAYRLGVVHQRLVSRLLGATLLGFGRKLNG